MNNICDNPLWRDCPFRINHYDRVRSLGFNLFSDLSHDSVEVFLGKYIQLRYSLDSGEVSRVITMANTEDFLL